MRKSGICLAVASLLAAGVTVNAEAQSLVLRVVDKQGNTANVRDARNVGKPDTGVFGAPEVKGMGGLMLMRGPEWVHVPWEKVLKVTVHEPEKARAGHALRCPVDLDLVDGTSEELHAAEGMNRLSGKTEAGAYKIDLVDVKELTKETATTSQKKP